jgi:hypothetical protein
VYGAKDNQPTEAFALLENKSREALKAHILKEPKNLIFGDGFGEILAHLAALNGELEVMQFLTEQAPWII